MVTRRAVVLGAGAALAVNRRARAAEDWTAALPAAFAQIEAGSGGRLGVGLIETGGGAGVAHRGDEAFPMCSTVKVLLAGAVLARIDRGDERLNRRLTYGPGELVPYSPVTGPRAGGPGLTPAELCEAAVTLSDNTAANLLLGTLGGPPGLTAFLRGIGDPATRLDRSEPDLNAAVPGDPRDTTTPLAFAGSLRRLVLGDALAPPSRALLTAWLTGSRTGDARIRAGVPADWRVGDKTGSGEHGTTNDVAVLWPPRRPPLILTVYLTGAPDRDGREATLAAVARAVAGAAG